MNLSLEQAMRLALYWQLPPAEKEYFLELVNLARADFPPLKAHIKEKLMKLKAANSNI